jgi:hypothetical protein
MERLGTVITATKAYYGEDIPGPAARIQLLDTENALISTWEAIKELPVPYFEKAVARSSFFCCLQVLNKVINSSRTI